MKFHSILSAARILSAPRKRENSGGSGYRRRMRNKQKTKTKPHKGLRRRPSMFICAMSVVDNHGVKIMIITTQPLRGRRPLQFFRSTSASEGLVRASEGAGRSSEEAGTTTEGTGGGFYLERAGLEVKRSATQLGGPRRELIWLQRELGGPQREL